jgi:hypothetical protein
VAPEQAGSSRTRDEESKGGYALCLYCGSWLRGYALAGEILTGYTGALRSRRPS